MHPRTSELLHYLDAKASDLRTAFEAVPADRRAVRPAPGRWSPAEVVHHVVIVERRIAGRIAALIEQARAIGRDDDESSVLTIVDTERMVQRTKPFATNEANEPRDTNAATVLSEFEDAHRAVKNVVATGDGLALGAVSAPHPALGDLTGYGWIAFMGAHAARHAAQIREDVRRAALT